MRNSDHRGHFGVYRVEQEESLMENEAIGGSTVAITLQQFEEDGPAAIPVDYQIADASRRAVNFIRSTATSHHARAGIRVAK